MAVANAVSIVGIATAVEKLLPSMELVAVDDTAE